MAKATRNGIRLKLPKYCNAEMLLLEHFHDTALVCRTYSARGDYIQIDVLGTYDTEGFTIYPLRASDWAKLLHYLNANI